MNTTYILFHNLKHDIKLFMVNIGHRKYAKISLLTTLLNVYV